jgi:small-conductance mechanosensitive channel/CRP-like cAMP-binding protein
VQFHLQPNVQTGLMTLILMTLILLAVLRFTRHRQTLRTKVKNPILYIVLLLTIYDILFIFGWKMPAMVKPYYLAVLYLSIAVLGIRLAILIFFEWFLARSKQYQVPRLLIEITQVVLFTMALILIVQDTLKIQLTTVLATSAIITVVLGLALQETLGNLFAGLALNIDPPYQAGDWVHAGDKFGQVVEVTWRATKLRTINNDLIVIPNGQIAKQDVINHSFPRGPHATRVSLVASYQVPPNKVAKVVDEVLASIPNVTMQPPPETRVSSYGDFSINYEIKFWMKDYGAIEPTLAAIRKACWYHFRRNEIEIPFPIRNVYLHEREESLLSTDQRLQKLSDSLLKVYLFAELVEEERRLIAEHLVEQHYAQGELIIREGELDDSLFIIDRGEVEVFIMSPHGIRKVLNQLHEGDFFGEMALLTGERRRASVEASGDVRVYRLDKENFKEVLERKPEILEEIGNVLSRRKDELTDLMAESSGSHAQEMAMNVNEAKSRILNRIRNYFGL